jgi:hypothetical protein
MAERIVKNLTGDQIHPYLNELARHLELTTRFLWKDLDETEESPKKMVFWTKPV